MVSNRNKLERFLKKVRRFQNLQLARNQPELTSFKISRLPGLSERSICYSVVLYARVTKYKSLNEKTEGFL